MSEPDRPKSLADPVAVAARRALLARPAIAALRPVLDAIRAAQGAVPDPDPLDGGAHARLLVLLETPGPSVRGTGFVSRDNPTGTAVNLFRLLGESGIRRTETLIWNAVPFVIHAPGALNRAPQRAEIAAGLRWLPPLLDHCPHLRVALLLGRVAAEAAPVLAARRPAVAVLRAPHPSPTFLCTSPEHPRRIAAALDRAAACLQGRAAVDEFTRPDTGERHP